MEPRFSLDNIKRSEMGETDNLGKDHTHWNNLSKPVNTTLNLPYKVLYTS